MMVDNPAVNQPPVACAGSDQVITLPTNGVTLNGTCSTDPDNNITTYQWTKLAGPSAFNIVNPNAAHTLVTNMVEGSYQFVLKVTDAGGLFATDTVQVTVSEAVTPQCGSNRTQVAARFVPVGSLSKPRASMAVGTVSTKILFAGGFAQGELDGTPRVDIYDMTTKTWSTSELSKPRYEITAVTAGNKIFFAGGLYGAYVRGGNNNVILSTIVDIYDVSTNTWSVTSLPLPRHGMAAAAIGDKVLFAGGTAITNVSETDRVEIYNIATKTSSVKLFSERKKGISAVTLGNRAYFAGGFYYYGGMGVDDSLHFSDRVEIYNNASGSWATSSLTEGKEDLAGTAVGNKIYWASGSRGCATM